MFQETLIPEDGVGVREGVGKRRVGALMFLEPREAPSGAFCFSTLELGFAVKLGAGRRFLWA